MSDDKRKKAEAAIMQYINGLFGRTEGYARAVSRHFTTAVNALLDLAAKADMAPDEVFYFADDKRLSAKATAILRGLYSAVYQEIRNGVIAEWGNANAATDLMLTRLFGKGLKEDNHFARWFARNQEAMDSFFSRKDVHGGLNLSQKVWKYTSQFKEEMELALSASLGRGDSAATVSRHVRQYLQEPERLFRRVRDAKGNLKLSKRAAAYHPGRGEYRSSYRNAMRLARTETNAAYRAADCDRWGSIPFVVGMEVKRSNHPFGCEVCELLKGKYPKDFVFTGWHPQCRCYIVPVLADEKERMAYHRAVLNGEDVSDWHFKGEITEPHKGFQKWIGENQERIENAKSLPYWIKDNPKYVGAKQAAQAKSLADIEMKIKAITKPREKNSYVSFEPISVIIIEKLKERKDLKQKLKLFEEIMSDDRAKELFRDKEARTIVFPGHKGSQHGTWKGIQQMAMDLNRNGENVAFLSERDIDVESSSEKKEKKKGKARADALVLFQGRPVVADFKYCITKKSNTLAGDLEDGFGQASTLVVKLENMDAGVFKDAIGYMVRNDISYGNIKIINKYGKTKELTYEDIKRGRYVKMIKGFLK